MTTFFLWLYLLELVGAAVVTTLGCVACHILHLDWAPSAPLWFAGYLLVYNLNRLFPDPADELNTPIRFACGARLRRCRQILVCAAALVLVIWPILTGRLWLVAALAALAYSIHFYSRPIPRIQLRLKDLPYLKSFIPPFVIAAVLVLWPIFDLGRTPDAIGWLVFIWVFLILTMNSLVFDYRDIVGDRRAGTRTIPALLGPRVSRLLIALIAIAITLCGMALSWFRLEGMLLPGMLAFGCAILLVLIHQKTHPLLLSLFADLLLVLPALAELLARFPWFAHRSF